VTHPYFDLPLPIVLGHRGAAGDAPENTLCAFERGLQQGAHILESDVHLTSDGVPVLAHDARVDRISEGSGAIADLTCADLKRLDFGYRFQVAGESQFPFRAQGVAIATLEEAFSAFPKARFNLELKVKQPELVAKCVSLVREHAREGLTLLVAANDEIQQWIRDELERSGVRAAIGASTGDVLAFVRSALDGTKPASDAMALQIPTEFGGRPLITAELVAHAHSHDVQVHAWTINQEPEITRLLDLGVDGIVTDYPGRMVRLLAERCD
jgi:glycerophosphoryl diester phosphodiesterase